MVAEYERAKIMERSRRGKRHAAVSGSVSVNYLALPGYRYVNKDQAMGRFILKSLSNTPQVVRQIFEGES